MTKALHQIGASPIHLDLHHGAVAPKLGPELGVDGVPVLEGGERQADPLVANGLVSEVGLGVMDGRWGKVHDHSRAV